jgi:hypothetical protein
MLAYFLATNADVDDNEGNYEIRGNEGASGDFSHDDGWEGVPTPSSREDVGNEASGQPVPSEGCGQGERPGLDVIVTVSSDDA